jgi:protein-S-isoprenylcysteine O-methyltransferase Ste14
MIDEQRPSKPHINKAGIGRMITVVLSLVATGAVFFLAAGTTDVSRAWLYYGGVLAYLVVAMTVISFVFPQAIETVNARGKFNKDVKAWDKVFGLAYTILLLLQPAVAGWDVRTSSSFELPWLIAALSLAVTLSAYAFVHWAMIVNKHAETGVRIQDERHHAVVASGPYRIVRHPFYLALIATQLVYPLAVGSPHAFIPAILTAALFIWRTAREDQTLRRELEGYEEFTARTRYRLLPGVW